MHTDDAIKEVAEELQKFQMQLPVQQYTYGQLRDKIALRINYLITNDFTLLVAILYRLDISEKKLKVFLSQAKEVKAGDIIAEMIIERQLQKIASRKAFKNNRSDIPDDEKW